MRPRLRARMSATSSRRPVTQRRMWWAPLLRRSRKISRNRSSSREKRYSTSISRSSRLRILPVGLRGSSSRKTTSRGTL